MKKIEIENEEILIVKQALSELKDRMSDEKNVVERNDVQIIDKVLSKIKEELNKEII